MGEVSVDVKIGTLQDDDHFVEEAEDSKTANDKTEHFVEWVGKSESRIDDDELNSAQHSERRVNKRAKIAEEIIGCTDNQGYLQFLIKYRGVDQADLVSSKEAKDKYPQLVADFIKERLKNSRQ